MTSRIKGPFEGTRRVDRLMAPRAVKSLREVEAAAAPQTAQLEPVKALDPADAPDAASAVAKKLRAGEMTVTQAIEELIEDAVSRQVGLALVGQEELAQQLRALLRSYAMYDPLVLSKIRRLTSSR